MKLAIIGIACTASIAACASNPPPTAHYAQSEAAVSAAKEAGAERVPDAAMHLKMAEDSLAAAQHDMANDDNDKADWLLARARSDAELAVALSHEAQAKAAAEQIEAQVKQTQLRRPE